MRILIFGASGFVGAQVLRRARETGWDAVTAGRRSADIAFDAVSDLARLSELMRDLRPELIVNCAAVARIDLCEADPRGADAVNQVLPEVLAGCARGGPRFVHLSTDMVFGGHPPRASGYVEDDPTEPLHHYGRSKVGGESRVVTANPEALVVRLPLMWGDSGGRGLGASDSLLAALRRGETLKMFTDEFRTPISVEEAVRGIFELSNADVRGLVHLAGSRRCSRFDLAQALVRELGGPEALPGRLVPVTRAEVGQAHRPADLSLDSSRARQTLPWLA